MLENDIEAAVAELIRTKGITRCPTACVLPTQGLVGIADRAALEEYALKLVNVTNGNTRHDGAMGSVRRGA
jgi:hypothetical protein